jgi:hypothetical protein
LGANSSVVGIFILPHADIAKTLEMPETRRLLAEQGIDAASMQMAQ